MTDRTAKQIGIAIVEFDGHYVVGTRRPGQALAGFSEFPGGKCKAGEAPEECVTRECLEEAGLLVTPVRLLERTEHNYAHAAVDLHFWLCRVESVPGGTRGKLPSLANDFQWKLVDELSKLTFPEANSGILNLLSHRSE